MRNLSKEHFDQNIIDAALHKISERKEGELKIHIIYAGFYYVGLDKLRSLVMKAMQKHTIETLMMTGYDLGKIRLITKEAMEDLSDGKKRWTKNSVNDDLELLFEDLQLGKESAKGIFLTYWSPKLTKEELKLVEEKNPDYFDTFNSLYPDVEEAEMKLSESDSKYVEGVGRRETFIMENQVSDDFNTSRKRRHSSTV